ncbi:uncharacterized protein LOC131949362 [Physella acuta]|uniref:uncharacterized protein LOC131949362 n=1 Tax=Physella acuta TaxID=109671 RepID=UPI0027DD56D8|nr:uncharacterized protein LOC131949362 [Physella acuta]XP_059167202.1 uncharacterized protein LOC131949362 [Physella acuta]
MRALLLAMTEEHHENRSWRSTLMVGLFLLLTLALNASSREQSALLRLAYNDSNDSVLLAFTALVTVGQILAAAAFLNIETSRGDLPNKEALVVILFCHAGNVFLHDYLRSLGSAETSLSTAFFQPFIAVVTLWLVTSVIPRPVAWTSTIAVGFGLTFMSINPSTVFSSDRTSLICGLSAFALILRNIMLRQLISMEHATVKPRDTRTIFTSLIAAMFVVLILYFQISEVLQIPMLCSILTCALSAALLYITTQLLKSYTVVFISLFYVWALLIESILITPSEHKPDWLSVVIALVFILLGHYLFFKDYTERMSGNSGLIPTYTQKPVNAHEQLTRVEFLIFTALVLGVVFYVFQPKVSQRDLNTLSYVGLDQVIRKLLTVEAGTGLTTVLEKEGDPHQLP